MKNTKNLKHKIDVVIPFYNENQNLKILIPSLYSVLNSLKKYQFRLIFIDDGSQDLSSEVIINFKNKKKIKNNFFLLKNKINKGQTYSYKKYFKKFKSNFFLRIDSDNQDNPNDIKKIFKIFDLNHDMILTYRQKRKHNSLLIFQGKIYTFFCNFLTKKKLKTFTSSMVLYRSKFLNFDKLSFNDHRYLPLLAILNGAKKINIVDVKHNKRIYGNSKYKIINKIIFGPFEFLFFILRFYLGLIKG